MAENDGREGGCIMLDRPAGCLTAADFTGGVLPGLPVAGCAVQAGLLEHVGVVVQHVHRALGREAEAFAAELGILVAVQERLEVVFQVIRAEAVLGALEERIQVDHRTLGAVEGGLVLIGDGHLRRLAGLNGGIDFVVDVRVGGSADLGMRDDAVRVGLVELVQHALQEVLVGLGAVVPVSDLDVLALEVDRVHHLGGGGWIADGHARRLGGGRGRGGRCSRCRGRGRGRRCCCGGRRFGCRRGRGGWRISRRAGKRLFDNVSAIANAGRLSK